MEQIELLVKTQRDYFQKGKTLSVQNRRKALERLRDYIKSHEKELEDALAADLGKSRFESYLSEIGMLREELDYQLHHLNRMAGRLKRKTPAHQFFASSYVRRMPYGVVLIMSPWNYPVMLSLSPLIGAVAAGNCVVLKPSAYAPAVSAVLQQMIKSCFQESYVAVVEGGRAENAALLEQRFDYIFFTGSMQVGKLVMEKAAHNLTPVSLELGGKSPCIVDETANLQLAARRIVFGKFLNAGQTCVAPDYILVDKRVSAPLIEALKKEILRQYGAQPLSDPHFPRIINQKHYDRLEGLLKNCEIVYGGKGDGIRLEPTVLKADAGAPVMCEEIFGPLLPVLEVESFEQAAAFIEARPRPLACYLFTHSKAHKSVYETKLAFGGGCINDTLTHLANPHLGFGGVGESGMGRYHGKHSFETFTYEKSILRRYEFLDVPFRYRPATAFHAWMVRALFK